MKLKLTDKIRKFFGNQAEHQEDLDGEGHPPVFGGSLEASLANLAAVKQQQQQPSSRHSSSQHQQHNLMPQQLQSRPYCPAPGSDHRLGEGQPATAAAASGAVAVEKHAHILQLQHLQVQQHHSQQLPSCANSQQKDAKELTSGLRTTGGQDESYSLQNEVYFPQLLLTLQGGTPEQKAVAAEALFNYTAESDAARQRATQAGVVAHLVDLLRAGTEHGKMYAAYTLSSLTTIDESLEQMHAHGAIPALIDILSSCPLLVCKKGAMRALGRLARSDDAAQAIVAAGGLGPIIALLSRADSSLVRRCLIALYFIGADKDALQQAIGAAGALPQLLLLARSDSPDVQAEATDVLKVLCRNVTCGRMLAELGGIDVLVSTASAGLTSRAKAAATRALQRLQDIPDLSEALAASTTRDLQLDMSPLHSSQLNSGSAAPAAAAAAAAPPATAIRSSSPLPGGAPAAGLIAPLSSAQHAAAAPPAVHSAGAAAAAAGFASQPEDIQQLAQVLVSGNSRWLREKAAAAVEQLATDNPAACRDLAGLGALAAMLGMLDAANSSSTRRAAARALGQLSDDAVMLVHLADVAHVTSLVLAAPQLSGSAQRGVMRVLHSLASVPNAVTTCFPKQQTVHSMMQILDSPNAAAASATTATGQHTAGAAAAATQRSTMSGGSNGGGAAGGPDAGVSARALEVLLAVCRAEGGALTAVKEYPGGFKLLVSQLQHGPRSACSHVLQLLSILAQHKQHQEDLLKCGVVPTLLLLYRSDDSTVALQAARIMEALSEPASSILQRSLSAGGRAADASSSDGSSVSSSSDGSGAHAGLPAAGPTSGCQPSPLGAAADLVHRQQLPAAQDSKQQQRQQPASSSSSNDSSSTDCVAAGTSYSSSVAAAAADASTAQHSDRAGSRPAGPPSSPRPLGALSPEPPAAGKRASASNLGVEAAAPGAKIQQQQPEAAACTGNDGKAAAARGSSTVSPARRVAAVAAVLEATFEATDAAPASSSPQAGQRSSQSSIPCSSRAGSKTPTGLGPAPALVAKRPTPGKPEQHSEATLVSQQQQQPLQQQQHGQVTVQQQHQPQASPDAGAHACQQQQRGQSQMPSRLPRASASGPSHPQGNAASSSSSSTSPAEPGSRTGTPDPAKRKQQHLPAASASASASAAAPGRSPSASAVQLRALAAQKQSNKSLSGCSGGAADAGAAEASSIPGSPVSASQQQSHEAAGTGRVMQMAAAIVANAEAVARSSSPQRPAKQPSQQQQPPELEAQTAGPSSGDAAAAAAEPAQASQPAGSSSGSPAGGRAAASKADGSKAAASAPAPAVTPAPAAGSSSQSSSAAKQAAAAAPAAPAPAPAAAVQPKREKPLGATHLAAPGPPAAADADDLLSSTYDNLHGLLLKKSDIDICRTAEGRKCRLGEGGFGIVYKAVMNGVDEVAVKLVKADTPSRKELELFLKEVQTLAKLHHRNIVQFYGACLEMGSMFFVTELMKGGDLYSALRHHSETMKWERLGRKVALDVALGLNYLHAQRPPMMHRDLKSPNVLLSEEGVAKIADVGMVRSQVKDLVTAQPVMTPLWAAPEVVRHERASIKADIWSYGILIWELITGEDITEYQPLSISRQVGPSPNAKAMTLPARCPAVARKLFVACTQMDPERRPGAQQLVEWLRADIAASRA